MCNLSVYLSAKTWTASNGAEAKMTKGTLTVQALDLFLLKGHSNKVTTGTFGPTRGAVCLSVGPTARTQALEGHLIKPVVQVGQT